MKSEAFLAWAQADQRPIPRYKGYWLPAAIAAVVGTPIVMTLKDYYPWIMGVTIFVGAAVIAGIDVYRSTRGQHSRGGQERKGEGPKPAMEGF